MGRSMVYCTQSYDASMFTAELFGSTYGVSSFQSSPPVMVRRCRTVMRRLRSSMFLTRAVSKNESTGVSMLGKSPRVIATPISTDVMVLVTDCNECRSPPRYVGCHHGL